ncbi:hypothetical protein D0N87_33395, partial [Pseudomonas sp. ATCC 13867]
PRRDQDEVFLLPMIRVRDMGAMLLRVGQKTLERASHENKFPISSFDENRESDVKLQARKL